MISDYFTTLTNPTIFDYVYGFEQALGGYFIFSSLLAMLIVLGISAYNVNNDLLGSFLHASYLVSVVGFMLSIAKTSTGVFVFDFSKEVWFMVITVLLFVAKKSGD